MGSMLRSYTALGLAALLLATLATLTARTPVHAQGSASLRISPPDTGQFPEIRLRASVLDGAGLPIPELTRQSFQVFEDGQPVELSRIEQVQAGIRQVFVINTINSMGVRDTRGRTRFDYVRTALMDWFRLSPASVFGRDDLSLVTAGGVLISHAGSSALLASQLDRLAPEYASEGDLLAALLTGIGLISSEAGASQGPAAVVFATPPLLEIQNRNLQNALSLAQQSGISVYPVIVGLPQNPEDPIDLSPFQRLADSTGGTLTILDSAQPNLQTLAERLLATRTQYLLTYRSQIREAGRHSLRVEVINDDLSLVSSERQFSVEVAPAEIVLVQPPTEIRRATDDPTLGVDQIPPASIALEYLISFPDGHPRSLRSVELLVDGQVVAEQRTPPFGEITWDISGYLQDTQPRIQIALTDELGLQNASLPHRVQIRVDVPTVSLFALGPALQPLLAVLGILIIMIGAVVLALRLRRGGLVRESFAATRTRVQPILQRAGLDHASSLSEPEAFLVPLHDGEPSGSPIPLIGVDLTLGSDASLAAHPLREPSVSGLHARVIRQAGGQYLIRDQGSTAGTWVNYQSFPSDGIGLQHGDLIHLGRVCLRFELAEAPPPPQIEVHALDGNPEPAQSEAKS